MKTTVADAPDQPPAPTDRAERRLEGWALSKAVATTLGWTQLTDACGYWNGFRPVGVGLRSILPAYHEDETRCFRDLVGPLIDEGYSFGLWRTPPHSSFLRGWTAAFRKELHPLSLDDRHGLIVGDSVVSAAEAIARAYLKVKQQA